MNWKISIVFSLLTLFSCQQENRIEEKGGRSTSKAEDLTYLIEANELKKIVGQSDVKLIDFRKKEYYDKGHLQGALHVWRPFIENPNYPYGGMMAEPRQIELLFSGLGIQNDDMLVIYDDNGLCDAARLWWLLQNYDFTNVKLFHGGTAAWGEAGGTLVTERAPILEKTVFKLTETPSMKYHISKDELNKELDEGSIILDTRTRNEYSGLVQKEGAAKGGRIPNSIHVDWARSVNFQGDKKFKSLKELQNIYEEIINRKNEPILVYCHSGVRSAHTTFVLTQLLGFQNVRNYDGSWTEWSHFDELRFVKDSLTIRIN